MSAPVAVGGVGGSGTRVVADVLVRLGYYLGSDLNESLDNLWFTLLFKRLEALDCSDFEFRKCVTLFLARMRGRIDFDPPALEYLRSLAWSPRLQHDVSWLRERTQSFCMPTVDLGEADRWGWKEPNTHMVLDRLMPAIPRLKYVHVVRHGLDIAYGPNQNQLRLWGSRILDMDNVPVDPRHALKFWCRVQERVIGIFDRTPDRCLWLDFDRLCEDPRRQLSRLLEFLAIEPIQHRVDRLAERIQRPPSSGRFRCFDLSALDPEDIRVAANFGFSSDSAGIDPPIREPRCEPSAGIARPKRTALVILGMHRSGTSALTRVAGLLGFALPADLMPPVVGVNEAGFWESMGICRLNDVLLRCGGSRWDEWYEVAPRFGSTETRRRLQDRAMAAIDRAFGDHGFIVVKDPRICRLFPFWRDALQTMGMDILCLLPIRNPIEVAASLSMRDGFHASKAYLLWLRHVLDAEAATRSLPRAIVAYDDLMSNWRACTQRIARNLRMSWPLDPTESTAEEIDRFLDTRLRHHRASLRDLAGDPSVPHWVKETFVAVVDLAERSDGSVPLTLLDRVREELRRADQAIRPSIDLERTAVRRMNRRFEKQSHCLERQGVRIQELESNLRDALAEVAKLKSVASLAERKVVELESITARSEVRIAELESILAAERSTVAVRHSELTASRHKVELQRDALAFRLNALQSSAIWPLGRYLFVAEQRFPETVRALSAIPKVLLWTLTMRIGSHLRIRNEVRRILASGLFDETWYVRNYPQILASGHSAPLHWSLFGWRQGLDPNPLFDTDWYLERNPDVRRAGIDPLVHYSERGASEGRDPHPAFSSRWYREHHPDTAGINPLAHFLRIGALKGCAPNPSFRVAPGIPVDPVAVACSAGRIQTPASIYPAAFGSRACGLTGR